MNKKLFSWKALAGLALLVAMGMTSCKNTTEVDPNDPYNTQKPVKPGTSTAGDADLTFTITNASGGDLTSLWNAWKKSNADAAKELMAEEEVTIALNFANYKLDGNEIAIPAFVNTPNGSIINIVVSGFAEAKKPLNLSTKNLKGAEVNITLPSAAFDMVLDAQGSKVTLDGDATSLTSLKATADNSKKNALTIEEDVTVAGIDFSGALNASADNVLAKLVSGTEGLVEGKGALVGHKDNGAVYVKNLIATADVTVNGADKAALESVTLAEGVTMTLGAAKSQIESIIGLGTDKKPSKVNLKGDADDFSKIGAATNVTLAGNAKDVISGSIIPTKIADASDFEACVFDMDVDLYSGASNVEFKGDVNLKVDDLSTINFANVEFAKTAAITLEGTETVNRTSVIKMFQWNKANEDYEEVTDDDEDNLTAANAKGDDADFSQTEYNSWTRVINSGITTGMKDGKFFHFKTIETEEATLKDAKEAYDKLVEKNGKAALATTNASAEYNAYKAAWEALYGTQNADKDPIHNDKGEDQVASFTAYTDKEINDGQTDKGTAVAWTQANYGDYRWYKAQWTFVTDGNKAIDGSDWFTVSFKATSTVVPDAVDLVFDGDCTYGGKALSANALNNLIDGWWPNFTSAKDAWFKVTYDGETYEWKRTTGGYILQ